MGARPGNDKAKKLNKYSRTMEELELKIEERLYALNEDQLARLGQFLSVDVGAQPSRRYKVKKLREHFELNCNQQHEGGDLQKFLNDVWAIVSGDEETIEEVVTEPQQASCQDASKNTTQDANANKVQSNDSIPTLNSTQDTNSKHKSSDALSKDQDGVDVVKQLLSLNLRKEFKISGSIGGDSKDKLSFVGLMRQVDNGVAKGHEEREWML